MKLSCLCYYALTTREKTYWSQIINNMCFYTCFLSLCFPKIRFKIFLLVISESYRATGVFLLIEGGTYYTLNFTAARDACLSLNVTMATEYQISKAVTHGLETCKYGWIAEQIAVIPRISPKQNCERPPTVLLANRVWMEVVLLLAKEESWKACSKTERRMEPGKKRGRPE
uniref:Link domain-containing protein n=1 Tax=Haplochromis burtoni TaxID=8153 RepID=A0A3Q2UZ62_HAPBU